MKVLQVTRLSSLAGLALAAGLRFGASTMGRPEALRTTRGWDELDDDALDAVWTSFKSSVEAVADRGASFVRWRYARSERYVPIGAWSDEGLVGWAVVRTPAPSTSDRLAGVAVASLSDLVFPVDRLRAGLALVEEAERLAHDLGADALLCSGSHPCLEDVLRRRGFLTVPGNVHVLAKDDESRVFPQPLSGWWLTRGDAQSDAAF